MSGTDFAPFAEGNTVKAIVVSGCDLTRKQIDKVCADVEVQAGMKPYWFKVDENGELAGGVAKFLQDKKAALTETLGLKPGCLVGKRQQEGRGAEDRRRYAKDARRGGSRPYG